MTFEEAIKEYLDKYASKDAYFASKYDAKKIASCCKYIISQAKEKSKDKSCVALTDDEVYAIARHFYDESIKDSETEETSTQVKVSVKNDIPKKKKEQNTDQLNLFDLLGE